MNTDTLTASCGLPTGCSDDSTHGFYDKAAQIRYKSYIDAPWGCIIVSHDEHYLYSCQLIATSSAAYCSKEQFESNNPNNGCNPLQVEITKEISQYFNQPRHRFQLAFKLSGSPFQRKVWNALSVIPYGQTVTYGQLAHELQTSPRAIGQACKTNPLPLFIPCHRVIAKDDIGGFMGQNQAIDIKKTLLVHECAIPTPCEA